MDKVYKNTPDYIRTKVIQLRFVDPRFDRGKQAKFVFIGPTFNGRQIRVIHIPLLTRASVLQTTLYLIEEDS